jgi:hypothetical protein
MVRGQLGESKILCNVSALPRGLKASRISGPQPVAVTAHLCNLWRGRGDGERMPGTGKATLSIGLSLPDGHLVRNAA